MKPVREAVSDEMAGRMAQMKKQDMAEAAEQLLAATGWLPALMRTPRTVPEPAEFPPPDAVTEAKNSLLSPPSRWQAGTACADPALSWSHQGFWPRALGARGVYVILRYRQVAFSTTSGMVRT